MNRMFVLIFASLVLAAAMSGKGVARVMGTGDVAVAQVATPAVVNIALWKLRPPTKAGDPPRRVRSYGSGFVIDPSGIIVTNRHVIDGALSIKVIFDNGEQLNGELNWDRVRSRPKLDTSGARVG